MLQFIKNIPIKLVVAFYVFFREFGCIRVGNKFQLSTKKFWFQVAQITFVAAVALKIFGNSEIASRISDNLIGLLLGHAGSAAMTYGLSKSGDIQRAQSSVASIPSQTVHQQEEIIPEEEG